MASALAQHSNTPRPLSPKTAPHTPHTTQNSSDPTRTDGLTYKQQFHKFIYSFSYFERIAILIGLFGLIGIFISRAWAKKSHNVSTQTLGAIKENSAFVALNNQMSLVLLCQGVVSYCYPLHRTPGGKRHEMNQVNKLGAPWSMRRDSVSDQSCEFGCEGYQHRYEHRHYHCHDPSHETSHDLPCI